MVRLWGTRQARALLVMALVGASGVWTTARAADPAPAVPPAPAPEHIELRQLPLPPNPDESGVCHNPTGCIESGQAGGFLANGKIVSAMLTYAGAPAAPHPASIYTGHQIVLLHTDGSPFPDGQPVKCLTCGTPEANRQGIEPFTEEPEPMPFRDGFRLQADSNILDCSPYPLSSPKCTPQTIHIYRIRWNNTADGSGPGGSMRELRLHPDNVHLGWNHLVIGAPNVDPSNTSSVTSALAEPSYVGRLVFNPAPETGTPLAPRYDLANVYAFVGPTANQPFIKVDPDHPDQLMYDPRGAIGEFRGWTGDGRALLGQCWWQQDNPDMCATDLETGVSRPLTADPGYIDPIDMSPDNNWVVALESRYQDRHWFLNGLPGVPPINDMSVGAAAASIAGYKIGAFRLFQPYLLDRYPERPDYRGQRINECQPPETATTANSVCDANWGTRSDPRWSLDGTKITFGQTLAQFPDCHVPTPSDQHGPVDPLGCPTYTGEGGNTFRIMIATLTDRTPHPIRRVEPLDDSTNLVPWGTKYEHGPDPSVTAPPAPPGVYTLKGRHSGEAKVVIGNQLAAISTVYTNYSDDGRNFINGTESVTSAFLTATWNTALTLSDAAGNIRGQRFTSPGGYTSTVISGFTGYMKYTGMMTTILDGKVYLPPPPAR